MCTARSDAGSAARSPSFIDLVTSAGKKGSRPLKPVTIAGDQLLQDGRAGLAELWSDGKTNFAINRQYRMFVDAMTLPGGWEGTATNAPLVKRDKGAIAGLLMPIRLADAADSVVEALTKKAA